MTKWMKKYKWYLVITSIFTAAIIFVVTFFSIFSIITVDGTSMVPTLTNGQVVLVNKATKNVNFFDIVVFKWRDRFLIKRLVGLPGDTIEFKDDKIFRNGKELSYPFYENLEHMRNRTFHIPQDKFFVLGDNINNSTDSRFIGLVSKNQIYGVKA